MPLPAFYRSTPGRDRNAPVTTLVVLVPIRLSLRSCASVAAIAVPAASSVNPIMRDRRVSWYMAIRYPLKSKSRQNSNRVSGTADRQSFHP